ncbi:MAG: hypothetical protein NVS2B9_04450 [Myxococcales bacterium]
MYGVWYQMREMPKVPKAVLPPEDQAAQAVEERLRKVADHFEPALRPRVARLLTAATDAILSLPELDLVRRDGTEESASHSLVVWEELAPVMGETVSSVNAMLDAAQEAFPPKEEKDPLDNLDDAFGPDTGPGKSAAAGVPETTEEEIASLVAAVSSGLRRDVSRLGERLRNPTVVADHWNLVSDLLEFRGRLRAGIGELIFQIASSVTEAERPAVVPGYAAELEASLLLRDASTNLSFLFRGHAKRIAAASDERTAPALGDALKDLHSFARTRAVAAFRTADKRIFLETRAQLIALGKATPPAPREIKPAVENLARFLDSLSVISRRENLRLHDRAQLAAAGRKLEQAQAALAQPARARLHLSAAVRSAGALYGRDAVLDAYLRGQRHFPADWLADAEVSRELQRFGALLAQINPP